MNDDGRAEAKRLLQREVASKVQAVVFCTPYTLLLSDRLAERRMTAIGELVTTTETFSNFHWIGGLHSKPYGPGTDRQKTRRHRDCLDAH